LLPADRYWIRASIARDARSVSDMIAILPQAVSASFVDRGDSADHLNQPLPAGRITALAVSRPEVKAIRQPFTSTLGAGPEPERQFARRVSERLRHKDRALTVWDYERLVLEAFPEVYKVKCLPVDGSVDPRRADQIQVIVVPDIRGKQPADPFEPKVSPATLEQIKQFLLRRTPAPASALITVKNARYFPLRLRLNVRFLPGYEPGYYSRVLDLDLQRYLAPWAFDLGRNIVFGGWINGNLIVDYIQRRPYVDYVAGVKLQITLAGEKPRDASSEAEMQRVFDSAPDAVLVSAREHIIDLIRDERYIDEYFDGIGYMEVSFDFVVA
jgi:hypothetical protein